MEHAILEDDNLTKILAFVFICLLGLLGFLHDYLLLLGIEVLIDFPKPRV